MMIAPNTRAPKREKERGEVKGEYGRILVEEEENGATQSATCVKGIEWGLGRRGLRMVAVFKG